MNKSGLTEFMNRVFLMMKVSHPRAPKELEMIKIQRMFRRKRSWLLAISAVLMVAVLSVLASKASSVMRARNKVSDKAQNPNSFNPERQKQLSAESESLRIYLERTESCRDCLGRTSFVFMVNDKLRGSVKTFTIENETAQIDQIFIVNQSRAIVIGSVSGTIRSVNIIDPGTGAIVDSFPCIYPSLSKDGHFLAYVKSASGFSSPEAWSYVYLIYDLKAEPARNRSSSNEGGGDAAVVGVPVYPAEGVTNRLSEGMDESSAHMLASERLFWTDEVTLAFVDRWQKVNKLVIVDLSSGLEKFKVKAQKVDSSKITKSCGESVASPENLINVTDITVSNNGKKLARLSLEPASRCLTNSVIDVAIP